METIDVTELLIAGLEKAREDGFVFAHEQENGPDYLDIRATMRFGSGTRTVFIRSYTSERKLNRSDIEIVNVAAKRAEAQMTLVIGDGREAIQAAAIEGIGLVPYDVVPNLTSEFWVEIFKPAVLFYGFKFRSEQLRQDISIPEEPALLAYMMKEMRIVSDEIDTTPEKLVEGNDRDCAPLATSVPQTFSLQLPERTVLIHPNTLTRTPVTTFSFEYRLVPASQFANKKGLGEDHYLLGDTLQEGLAKKNPDVDPHQIEIGFPTKLRFGKYYYNPKLQFSYYCESAKKGKDSARLVLLESYQGGHLLQARLEVGTTSASQFVEITNPEELSRLAKLYDRFTISDKNLEGRFTTFVRTLEGAECIDDLKLTFEQQKAKKADYFFDGRKIISEFKSLQTDTSEKIAAILEPYRNSPVWPMLYGEQELPTLLSFLPNGREINAQIVLAVTDSIEGIIESANRQIRATKESFALPDSGGLLVIFNEAVDVLSPDVVAYRIGKTLRKKTQQDEVRFPHVTLVLLINTGHYTQLTSDVKAMPILVMPTGLPDPNGVETFARSLLPKWSTFDGQPLLKVKTEDFSKLTFNRFQRPANAKTEHKRYDTWRVQYRRAPYLRALNENQLLTYGRQLFDDIAPRFLKGAPKTPQSYLAQLMQRFTHFLDETGLRGIDLRKLLPQPERLKEKLETLYEEYNKPTTTASTMTRAKQRRESKAYKNKIGRGAPCPCGSGKTYGRCHGRESMLQ